MTVADLIRLLQSLPPDLEVWCDDDEQGCRQPVISVTPVGIHEGTLQRADSRQWTYTNVRDAALIGWQ